MKQTRKESQALQYLQEKHYCEWSAEYGEPGYSQPEKGILFANWNPVPRGLCDWLESCGYELQWSDEWTVANSGKAYRTSPDCYEWQCQLVLTDDGEWLEPDDGPACAIEECAMTDKGQPARLLPPWVSAADLTATGYALFEGDKESGFHAGQTDEPGPVAAAAFAKGAESVVFVRTEQSQFYARWECWALFPDVDERAVA